MLRAHPGCLEYDLPQPKILSCFDALEGDPDYSGPGWTPGLEWEPPVVPSVEDWQPYRDVLDQVYDDIWKLREGRPVVLRAHDICNPFIAPWRELGIEPECTANWEIEMQLIQEAAEANGAVFVSFFDAFNGRGTMRIRGRTAGSMTTACTPTTGEAPSRPKHSLSSGSR